MARSAAAKKVAKAASTGAGGKGALSDRNFLFPGAMVLVALLGIILIFVARDQRYDLAPQGDPTTANHWHSAYNVYVCDEISPSVYVNDSDDDRTGIHTHGDGLIHIHPFLSTVTGQYATVGAFMDESELVFDDSKIELPIGTVLDENNFKCGDDEENAELRVLKWNTLDAETPTEYLSDLKDVRFNADGQLFTFAMVSPSMKSSDIPRPDDSYLKSYTTLPNEQQPIGEDGSGSAGPTLPAVEVPATEEPSESELPESEEPSEG